MRIGVLCSGGDAPGMNANVRAVVRAAVSRGHEVVGIRHGYQGLLEEDFHVNSAGRQLMTARCVSNIIQRGGTILRSSRSDEFRTEAGRKKAAEILTRHKIEGLVACGGDGTFRGAIALAKVWPGQVIGTPGTIDNDLIGTDYTIGFHTAVATAVDAVDKLRDTAESHERLFLVEVMGRHSGFIALYTALAAAAEIAAVPETKTDYRVIHDHLCELKKRGKRSIIVVVAEGDESGGAEKLRLELEKLQCPFSTRSVNLGHVLRGGSPVVADRLLASRTGEFAVRALWEGKTGAMAGEIDGKLVLTSFSQATAGVKQVPDDLLELLKTMSH
jgi:6-phosphofructokinase 1